LMEVFGELRQSGSTTTDYGKSLITYAPQTFAALQEMAKSSKNTAFTYDQVNELANKVKDGINNIDKGLVADRLLVQRRGLASGDLDVTQLAEQFNKLRQSTENIQDLQKATENTKDGN